MAEKIKQIDLRTPLQKKQAKRREHMVAAFRRYRERVTPDTSDNCIMAAIAEEMGCTRQNVRATLLKCGEVKKRKKRR